MKHKYLSPSEPESKIFGLKIGRSERLDSFDENFLLKDIIEGEFDICRIKVCAENKDIFKQLDNLGIPYHLYNILSQSGKITGPEDMVLPNESQLVKETYDGSKQTVLFELVESAISEETGVNFFNFYFEKCLPLQKRITAAQQYAHTFINAKNSKRIGWLFKFNDEYVGFCLLIIDKAFSDLVFFGVKGKFRGKSFSREIQKFALDYCYRNNLSYMGGDIAIQNVGSLKSVLNVGGSQRKSFLNLVLSPFFSYSGLPLKEFAFRPAINPAEELFSYVFQNAMGGFVNRKIISIKSKETAPFLRGNDYSVKVTYPVTGEKHLVLARVYDYEKKLVCFSYFEFGYGNILNVGICKCQVETPDTREKDP